MSLVKYLPLECLDPEQPQVLLWLNAVEAVQMFFIECRFVLFMTIVKGDGNVKCNQARLLSQTSRSYSENVIPL